MMTMSRLAAVFLAFVLSPPAAPAEAAPDETGKPGWMTRLERDTRTAEAWKARAADIRLQILVSAGLWPPFERRPLKPVVFGKLDRIGYTIERVRLETWPGFHLTGNLYRPRDKKGPFAGVVSPHGHWKAGRFNHTPAGSVPGRAITLARLGCVVFSYDMVGYGDATQLKHDFGDAPWGISLLGLQLWNSLRAVDFLCSLPDVDPKRIGATGASGGGTQTFLLAAVDDRIACAAPVCMVAAEFQGGCLCENAPLLRIGLNNVEIAAAAAPRPLLLVSATGDWTKHNPTREAPAIRKVYATLGVPERFACVQFQADHNYNKISREAVYDWFMTWLLTSPPPSGSPPPGVHGLPEAPIDVDKREILAVFGPDHPRPAGAVDGDGLAKIMRDAIRAQLESLQPRDAAALARFRERMTPALRATISVDLAHLLPVPPDRPPTDGEALFVQMAPPESQASSAPKNLLQAGAMILEVGRRRDPEPVLHGTEGQRKRYPATYSRTLLARGVRDVVAVALSRSKKAPGMAVRLVGLGEAGPAVLLARAVLPSDVKVAMTIVDVQGIDDGDPASWTGARAQPGILRVGGLRTAGILAAAAGGKLVLHNTQGRFDATRIREAFKAAGREQDLTVSEAAWSTDRILQALK
jgi:dienelactone hydrolase